MKRFAVVGLFLSGVMLAACRSEAPAQTSGEGVGQTLAVEGSAYTEVSVSELQGMLENKDFTLVNVHIPFEGDIAGTDLSIPYDQIDQNLDQLPADQDAQIVLYCRSGRMSAIAAQTLVSLGYTNVWNLSGGMVAWEQAGLSIER